MTESIAKVLEEQIRQRISRYVKLRERYPEFMYLSTEAWDLLKSLPDFEQRTHSETTATGVRYYFNDIRVLLKSEGPMTFENTAVDQSQY